MLTRGKAPLQRLQLVEGRDPTILQELANYLTRETYILGFDTQHTTTRYMIFIAWTCLFFFFLGVGGLEADYLISM